MQRFVSDIKGIQLLDAIEMAGLQSLRENGKMRTAFEREFIPGRKVASCHGQIKWVGGPNFGLRKVVRNEACGIVVIKILGVKINKMRAGL